MKKWKCTICGYIHEGDAPPEECPICKASKDKFIEFKEEKHGNRWRCTVCGHVHDGGEAPNSCPVCQAAKDQFILMEGEEGAVKSVVAAPVETTPAVAQPEPAAQSAPAAAAAPVAAEPKPGIFARMIMALHLHPILVHFPNGILPVVFVLLALSVFLGVGKYEAAAFYNMIAVLITMPLVLGTGYIEWKNRYRKAKTFLFITKIFCSIIATSCLVVLVAWRYFVPTVAAPDSPLRLIYFIVAAVMIGAIGMAGHLGGRLVFGGRKR